MMQSVNTLRLEIIDLKLTKWLFRMAGGAALIGAGGWSIYRAARGEFNGADALKDGAILLGVGSVALAENVTAQRLQSAEMLLAELHAGVEVEIDQVADRGRD